MAQPEGDDETDPRLSQIIDAIANGSTVDWAVWQDVANPRAMDTLGVLRVIADVAAVHRRLNEHDSAASLGDVLTAATVAQPHPRAPLDLSKGEPWGPLIVLERIDGGSFGDVFRAWDPALAHVVALKRSRYSSAADAARALREGQFLARIPPHPNVITVYGACEIKGEVGIWMEFLSGRSLQHVVKEDGAISCEEATHYGDCLCRALAHVHGAGVLHRDVKAANVMKAAGGRIILVDFGAGGEIGPPDGSEAHRLVGTLMYMAPELFDGKPATQQSDIYSLGVLLFYLVTGKYPVYGHSAGDVATQHRLGRRLLLSDARADLPMRFVRVVERAIAPNVAQRYRTAGEMLQELIPYAAPLPVTPDVTVKPIPATWTRYVLWSALGLVGVVSVLTGLGLINSVFFNSTLGRSEFANENLWDWFVFGSRSCFAPVVCFILALLGIGLLRVCRRLLIDWSPMVRAIDKRIVDAVERHLLDDVGTLSEYALLASALVLIGTWWYMRPFIDKLMAASSPNISGAPSESIYFLSPIDACRNQHDGYRLAFTDVTIFCSALWYLVIRLAMLKGVYLNRSILAGGAAVLILSLLLLEFPYRLLQWSGRDFKEVTWRGASCFILGEQQMDYLLFCPELSTPRNTVVRKDDPDISRILAKKDIFTNVAKFVELEKDDRGRDTCEAAKLKKPSTSHP
jgi:serine/threonine-protein kinase